MIKTMMTKMMTKMTNDNENKDDNENNDHDVKDDKDKDNDNDDDTFDMFTDLSSIVYLHMLLQDKLPHLIENIRSSRLETPVAKTSKKRSCPDVDPKIIDRLDDREDTLDKTRQECLVVVGSSRMKTKNKAIKMIKTEIHAKPQTRIRTRTRRIKTTATTRTTTTQAPTQPKPCVAAVGSYVFSTARARPMLVVKNEPLEAICCIKVDNGSFMVDPGGAQEVAESELLKHVEGDIIVVPPCPLRLGEDPFLLFRQHLNDVL